MAEGRLFDVERAGGVRRVTVRLIELEEKRQWDAMMREHHYLHSVGLIGRSLRYVAELDGEWMALVGWSLAAFKCASRDEWIGWPEMVKWRRLRFVANNSRFLVLPRGRIPNLASRVLGLVCRRLSSDWEAKHGHKILVVETFVDPERFMGTCYRAAGWRALGLTRGFGRSGGRYVAHGEPKRLFVRELETGAAARLRDATSWVDRESGMSKMKLDGRTIDGLLKVLMKIPDPRQRRGRRHSQISILGIAVCATLAGARGYTAMAEFASRLNTGQRKRLDCRRDPKTGQWTVPGEKAFREFFTAIDVEAVDAVLTPWLRKLHGPSKAVAIDGKTLRASGGTGEKVHLLGMAIHGTRTIVAQREVGAKTNEIPEAPQLLDKQDVRGMVVTADAMHTQQDLARQLVENNKADYCFTVKDNQPTLRKDIEELFQAGSSPPSA